MELKNWFLSLSFFLGLLQCGLLKDSPPLESQLQEREFCENESVDLSCGDGEVIMVSSALFGRFKVGVCSVTQDFGHIGCNADKMYFMDRMCSGKQECTLKVSEHKEELSEGSTCPEDLGKYLKVKHSCVRVTHSDATTCLVKKEIPLTPPGGYIASIMTQMYGIGSLSCPYTISIGSGKRLKLTVINFALQARQGCVKVCDVVDSMGKAHPVSLCRDKARETEVTTTFSTGDVRIEMEEAGALRQAGNFLLKYQVVGCADPPPQSGRHTVRQGDQLNVKCNQTGETRYLVCKGNSWSGEIQNCPPVERDAWIGEFPNDSFPVGILVIVSIGVALGVFIGGLLLIVIAAYMKRKQKEQQRKQMYMIAPQDYSDQQFRTLRSMANNQDPDGNPDCVQCTLQRSASAKRNTKEGPTYYPASSVDGSIKDYSMFERGGLKDTSKPAQNSPITSNRTLLSAGQTGKAHMYEHPKYTP